MEKQKTASNFLSILLFILMLLIASSCSQKQTAKYEEYLNFKTGNQWTYLIEMKPKSPEGKEAINETPPVPSDSEKSEKAKESGNKKDIADAKPPDSRSEITFKITGVQDVGGVSCLIKETVTNQDQNPREYYEVNPEKGLLLHRQDYLLFNPESGSLQLTEAKVAPPQVVMEFPLTPGKSWTRSADMGGRTQSAVFLVRGEEEAETPAGKFTALKIESHGGNSSDSGSTEGSEFTAFQWYARGVGMVREIVEVEKGTSTTVLKEYKPGSK